MILVELNEREAVAVISALASKASDLETDKTILENKIARLMESLNSESEVRDNG